MGASSFFVGNEAKRGSREDRFIEFEGFCCCGSEGGSKSNRYRGGGFSSKDVLGEWNFGDVVVVGVPLYFILFGLKEGGYEV